MKIAQLHFGIPALAALLNGRGAGGKFIRGTRSLEEGGGDAPTEDDAIDISQQDELFPFDEATAEELRKIERLDELMYDEIDPAEEEQEGGGVFRRRRSLLYAPSSCNDGVETEPCLDFSSLVEAALSADSAAVVPCGECYAVDYDDSSTVTLPNGLDVLGRLRFPETASVTINTTSVVVQGLWDMEKPAAGNKVKITLYGTEEKTLYHMSKCGGEGHENALDLECTDVENVGKKPFIVAGGKVNINAIDSTCPSWTKLKDVIFEPTRVPPPSCPQDGNVLVAEDGTFESSQSTDGIVNHWSSGTPPLTVETEIDAATGASNHYLHQTSRVNDYTGVTFSLDKTCLVAGRTYKFGFRYKVSGEEGTTVAPKEGGWPWANIRHMEGSSYVYNAFQTCSEPVPANTWMNCESIIEIDEDIVGGDNIVAAFHQNFNKSVDMSYDDVYFEFVEPDETRNPDAIAKTLSVDPAFASCVRPGEEILVTSYQYRGWDKEQVVKVASVDATSGLLVLEDEIEGDLPTEAGPSDEPSFAVEIARLERDVVFEAQADDPETGGLIGGHFMVLCTPGVVQTISGVAVDNFGQQGILGRYPIHFHMSGDVSGSVVSKNVVRNSNQRCFVVHGSHNVLVEDNVAYDTFGHCYILEDGGETGNTFAYNLGAKTKKQIHSIGASDHEANTFWITNAENHYVGNVAAGSEESGFWFDTQDQVNGASGALLENQGVKPRNSNLGTFRDNTAHSNWNFGLQLYRPGWHPSDVALLENVILYKQRAGVFWHFTENILMKNALLADHSVAVETFQNEPNNAIEDSTVIALSDDTRSRQVGAPGECRDTTSYQGINFAFNENKEGQLELTNVNFTGFGGIDCDALALSPGYRFQIAAKTAGGTMHARDLTFDSRENSMDIPCGIVPADGFENIYFEDYEGAMGPTDGASGFFVQKDKDYMTAFGVADSCSPVERDGSCALWCEGVCLRRAMLDADAGDYMVITDKADDSTFKYGRNTDSNLFEAVLPSGEYTAHFEDAAGEQVFPDYISDLEMEKAPLCAGHITESSIEILRGGCPDEITIGDGSADGDTTAISRNAWGSGTMTIASDVDGNNYFHHTGRTATKEGIQLTVDQNCAVLGDFYGLYVKYRSDSVEELRLAAGMHGQRSNGSWLWDGFMNHCRHAKEGRGWLECYSITKITQDMLDVNTLWAWIYWSGPNTDDVDYDDISFAKHTSWLVTCPNTNQPLITDGTGDMNSKDGVTGHWGNPGVSVQADSSDNSNMVFSSTGRGAYHQGVAFHVHNGCLMSGTVYTLSFRHRFHSPSGAQEGRWHARFEYKKADGTNGYSSWILSHASCDPSVNSEWADCSAQYSVNEELASAYNVFINMFPRESWNLYDYDLDDVSLLPTS